MKKLYTLIALFFVVTITKAQTTPNGDFESWTNYNYSEPQGNYQTSNMQAFYRYNAFNCLQVPDPYHGSYAIQLTTVAGISDTSMAYFINCNANGNPNTWTGGIPYTEAATGIRGYYKSDVPAGDTARMIVQFKGGGTSIGVFILAFYGTHSTYIPFQLNFTLSGTPDTVQFGAASSDFVNNTNIPGSMVQFDSISFLGVASQPALFNGDFENWNPLTISSLDSWYMNGGGQNPSASIIQSTDAYSGTYALELVTTLGDNNGVPRAQPGNEATGYYVCPSGGGGMCTLEGGYPFSNMTDTLCFYYKYAPASATDSAQANIIFKNMGIQMYWWNTMLPAAATYQYMELPFTLFSAIDTAIVMFQSTLWQDSLLTSIGSDLKIDDVHFKSQTLTTGITHLRNTGGMLVAPNPFSNFTTIIFADEQRNTTVKITDVLGKEIRTIIVNGRQLVIEKDQMEAGIYFIQITDEKKNVVNKKIVVE